MNPHMLTKQQYVLELDTVKSWVGLPRRAYYDRVLDSILRFPGTPAKILCQYFNVEFPRSIYVNIGKAALLSDGSALNSNSWVLSALFQEKL